MHYKFVVGVRHYLYIVMGVFLGLMACSDQSVVDFELTIPAPTVLVKDEWQNIQPSWHPDGEQVVYVAQSTKSTVRGSHICSVSIESREKQVLFSDSTFAYMPRFSPDGNRLLFISHRSGSADIWLYDLGDTSFFRISREPGNETFPLWSPDGKRIAFLTQGRIAFTNTTGAAPVFAQNIPYAVWTMAWSDDSGSLVFSAFQGGIEQLFRYHVEEQRVDEIAEWPIYGNWPACAHHTRNHLGSYIAYQTLGGIWLFKLYTEVETLIVESGLSPAWSPDGLQLVYTNGNNIMLESIWVMMDE